MTHELFDVVRKADLSEEDRRHIAYLEGKMADAKAVGVTMQAEDIRREIEVARRVRLLEGPPMSATECVIWRAWLPTVHSDAKRLRETERELSGYRFDRIPGPVLRKWRALKEDGLFEHFEIWTPEKPVPDPILIGVNGNTRHLIARWGESDANLVTFDDIKRDLVRVWEKGAGCSRHIFGFLCGVAILISVFVGRSLGLVEGFFSHASIIAVLILVTIGIYLYINLRVIEKQRKSSPLMTAIIADNARACAIPDTDT